MSEIEARLTHVRLKKNTEFKALCGLPSPPSSYSYSHYRRIHHGYYALPSSITICPACAEQMRATDRDLPVTFTVNRPRQRGEP